jgi:hypothetical protein
MLSRRALMGKLAVGVAGGAVALTTGVGRAAAAVPRREWNPETGSWYGDDRGAPVPEAAPATELAPAAELAPPSSTAVIDASPPSPATVVDAGPPATESAPPPWKLLRPLRKGSRVAHGWSVAELGGVVDGVCVLTLRNKRGRTHRVHICRNDGRPQGLVYTRRLDLVVMNGGRGDLPTEEGLAQAVVEVAHVLAANERHQTVVAELLPQRERLRLFAGPVDRRLR